LEAKGNYCCDQRAAEKGDKKQISIKIIPLLEFRLLPHEVLACAPWIYSYDLLHQELGISLAHLLFYTP
jgi:hypothetical protein